MDAVTGTTDFLQHPVLSRLMDSADSAAARRGAYAPKGRLSSFEFSRVRSRAGDGGQVEVTDSLNTTPKRTGGAIPPGGTGTDTVAAYAPPAPAINAGGATSPSADPINGPSGAEPASKEEQELALLKSVVRRQYEMLGKTYTGDKTPVLDSGDLLRRIAEAREEAGALIARLEVSVTRVEVSIVGAEAVRGGETGMQDPLILDLSGDGINTTGVDRGVEFDINGDGISERVSFVSGDDAFLVLDKNGNGIVDDGRELFGDATGAANGFEELARYDLNADGRINACDPVYGNLFLYMDANENGRQDAGELLPLTDFGIRDIMLQYIRLYDVTFSGDVLAEVGEFIREDGSRGLIADALLSYRT